ncbi:unnamed protein product [Vicia faba]|uniref:DUF4283 domain-containing protein n=1 Tax=Vicia faba TaxID=3906 RepID=A0AAV0YNE2_VICFA|nr:unnamed protein product [Vicia faba]
MMRAMLIWIKLPKLPLYLWGERTLDKIGSAIGVPMVTDECTTHKLRVTYARILVQVDITRKLVYEIAIKDKEGKALMQPVEYKWKLKFYDKFQKVGHQCGLGPKKNVWKSRQPKEVTKTDPLVTATISQYVEVVTQTQNFVQVIAPSQDAAEVTTPKNAISKSRATDSGEEMWTRVKSAAKIEVKQLHILNLLLIGCVPMDLGP